MLICSKIIFTLVTPSLYKLNIIKWIALTDGNYGLKINLI